MASGGVPCSSSCTIFSFHSSLPFFRLRACSAAGKSQGHEPVVPSTRPPSVGWGSRAEARQPKPRKIDSSFEQEGSEVTEIPSPLAPFAPVKPICISDVRWSVSTFGSFRCAALAGKPSASTPYRGKAGKRLQDTLLTAAHRVCTRFTRFLRGAGCRCSRGAWCRRRFSSRQIAWHIGRARHKRPCSRLRCASSRLRERPRPGKCRDS